MERKIDPKEARVGMHVKRLSGSWFEHSFWRSEFTIETAKDLTRLRQSGLEYIVIEDSGRGGSRTYSQATAQSGVTGGARTHTGKLARRVERPTRLWASESNRYHGETDRERAHTLLKKSKAVLRDTFEEVRLGRAIEVSEVTPIVDDVVSNVQRNPQALLRALRLKKKHEYTYLHSVAVCTLMVNLAIFMGKKRERVREYGLAGLLHDIGKMEIPESILDKQGPLTDDEFATIRNHSELGCEILNRTEDVPEAALDVCRHHHEKIDGTGYPYGLNADNLSTVARLGAICDVYDALTSNRAYKNAWTPAQALGAMWEWEGHFDKELLFTFMKSIEVYAPDLVVMLRSGRLGLTVERSPRSKYNRVLAFYDTREKDWLSLEEVRIDGTLNTDSIINVIDPEHWGLGERDALVDRIEDAKAPARSRDRVAKDNRKAA